MSDRIAVLIEIKDEVISGRLSGNPNGKEVLALIGALISTATQMRDMIVDQLDTRKEIDEFDEAIVRLVVGDDEDMFNEYLALVKAINKGI